MDIAKVPLTIAMLDLHLVQTYMTKEELFNNSPVFFDHLDPPSTVLLPDIPTIRDSITPFQGTIRLHFLRSL